jgi:hypothetical protein
MSTEIVDRLRDILNSTWDPLGVGDNPHLVDEYDRYIPRLLALIQQGADENSIEQTLHGFEKNEMGLTDPSAEARAAARAIFALARKVRITLVS